MLIGEIFRCDEQMKKTPDPSAQFGAPPNIRSPRPDPWHSDSEEPSTLECLAMTNLSPWKASVERCAPVLGGRYRTGDERLAC